jgi:hypothetical protein
LEAQQKKFVAAKHPEFDADLARLHLDPEMLCSDFLCAQPRHKSAPIS